MNITDGIFSASNEAAEHAAEKGGLPVFPAENPTRKELDDWLLLAKNSLVNSGFSALLRGDTLRE